MTKNPDLRSRQRFDSFKKVFALYEEASGKPLSRLEAEGLIHRFEYCFELAWKCLQDLLLERGYAGVVGPKPVLEQAFRDGIISDGVLWLKMLRTRNETTHLYDESVFESVLKSIQGDYLQAMRKFLEDFGKQLSR